MKTIFRLIILTLGFLGGIYVGVHMPEQAAKIDQIRSDEQAKLQAKIQPQIDAAVARAKIEVLGRLMNNSPSASTARPGFAGAGFVSGGAPAGDMRADIQHEMEQAKQQLQQAQGELNSAR